MKKEPICLEGDQLCLSVHLFICGRQSQGFVNGAGPLKPGALLGASRSRTTYPSFFLVVDEYCTRPNVTLLLLLQPSFDPFADPLPCCLHDQKGIFGRLQESVSGCWIPVSIRATPKHATAVSYLLPGLQSSNIGSRITARA